MTVIVHIGFDLETRTEQFAKVKLTEAQARRIVQEKVSGLSYEEGLKFAEKYDYEEIPEADAIAEMKQLSK